MNNQNGIKRGISGIILVDKPLGLSSMDICRKVRRAVPRIVVQGKNGRLKEKWARVGHCGTLDPLATGLVIVCIGKATKSVSQIMGQPKTYIADIDLSAFTITDDAEGDPEPVIITQPPTQADIQSALDTHFAGIIQQTPPAYSAIHINGQRAYKLARSGQDVELKPRPVQIYNITINQYAFPHLQLTIDCGKGTYIRSIARDLGKHLGTGGYLTALRRTQVGPYNVQDAVSIQRFDQPVEQRDLMEAIKE
ncbi:tRNA pseudouridine synthase B [Poriferisphaera corsica]|uniref:tRNA pseudouridine synthase B n=1 Tax=Poriferisphaera corsica TaxID=2528020 RepID=A0A517YSE3_9BACT|nr:tRNA pseudouridine(55) synthase TruB [Poriferisphaera corsica]QDU33136.1 tRNA pseudouridine synthase B [Poriferisphaera corsica]